LTLSLLLGSGLLHPGRLWIGARRQAAVLSPSLAGVPARVVFRGFRGPSCRKAAVLSPLHTRLRV
jgi:hypothetical protein